LCKKAEGVVLPLLALSVAVEGVPRSALQTRNLRKNHTAKPIQPTQWDVTLPNSCQLRAQ
jgi:hypothetical protein